jgi:hypothetical protein
MLSKEAKWINSQLARFSSTPEPFLTLNLGSSTNQFIDTQQPYIRNQVLIPLDNLGKLLNVDIKQSEGVDLVADFTNEQDLRSLKSLNPNLVVACNLLEHVENPYEAIKKLIQLIPEKSFLLLTGPRRFPYHPDPIDNMFRPKRRDLVELFKDEFNIIELAILEGGPVLTATCGDKSLAWHWLINRIKGQIRKPYLVYRDLKYFLYPSAAYCCILQRK